MWEIFITFLRIGLIGFGGPIALVAIIEREVCANKRWLTDAQFAEIFSICKLLPGPLAVQVAICCGYQRGKRLGGFIAGFSFLLPALVMIIVLGVLYQHHLNTSSPHLVHVFKFMQDATIAVILMTVWSLSRLYIKNISAAGLAIVALILIWLHPNREPFIILCFGFFGILLYKHNRKELYHFPALIAASASSFSLKNDFIFSKLMKLFIVCLKAGEFSFGTGLAILPLLHASMVVDSGWLNNQQFIDGLTLGQITPGPTTISIVFFGYVIAGFKGLLVALLGFYIPPMINSLVIIPAFWHKLTGSPYLKIFTEWAFPAVIGGITSATIHLGVASINSYLDVGLLFVAIIILYRKLLPIWALIPLYGLGGLLMGSI